jgi:small subunit ribosomal protein S29
LYAAPLRKSRSADAGPKFREARSARIKKKARREKLRPPAVGERKALRQRIVLSNTNALEVSGLQDLTVENMVDSRLRGQVLGLPVPLLDRLRAVQAFRPPQGWSLFRRPTTLVRRETLELARLVEKISGCEEKGKTITKIITGGRGTGKTVYLLQAITMAFLKNWVVITVPEGNLPTGSPPPI